MLAQQHIGVLAVPTETCSHRRLAIDKSVVVDENDRRVAVVLQALGNGAERAAQRLVVVAPGVAGHASGGTGSGRRHRRSVGAGPDDEGPGAGEGGGRVSGPLGVAVGEVHATVQAGGLALGDHLAGAEEGLGLRHTDGVQPCGKADGAHVFPEGPGCAAFGGWP